MKLSKRDSRTKTPPERKRTKVSELPTPPIPEVPEPISNVLQGDEIEALAIKEEDLKKLRTPRPCAGEEKAPVVRQVLIRKPRPQEAGRKTHYLVAYPTALDASTKPPDYSEPEASSLSSGSRQIQPHSILGSLQDFKRIALARGNTKLAEMISEPPSLDGLILIPEKMSSKGGKKAELRPLPTQHRALQNWQRNMALRRKQQDTLCKRLGKPASELLLTVSEDHRRVQEERDLIDRCLPALHPGKGYRVGSEFWNQPEYIGDELTGLVITQTQKERGYPEPITHVGKPLRIQAEAGSQNLREPWFRYSWDKSLFLTYRRQELRQILAELDFHQPDIDGLEVIGRGQPFSSVSTQCFSEGEKDKEDTYGEVRSDPVELHEDVTSVPVIGPSLRFCGKPARWVSGTGGKGQIGIASRITFEALAGEKVTSSLTVSNDGTAAVWYDWLRLSHPNRFENLRESDQQRFYFNTRAGVILPGETKDFLFLFKSPNAGIFQESWEFRTHPTLLGGAVLQVTLWGIALYQDLMFDAREILENRLATQEATVIVQEMLNELLRGIRSPERAPSPVDAYLTEEDVFCYKNPQLHYQYQVVRGLHELWNQYMAPPPKEEEVVVEEEPPGQASSKEEELSLRKSSFGEIVPQKSPEEEIGQRQRSSVDVVRLQRSSVGFSDWQRSSMGDVHWQRSSMGDVHWQRSSLGEAHWQRNSDSIVHCQRSSFIEEETVVTKTFSEGEIPKSTGEEEEPTHLEWNLCFEDFKQAIMGLSAEDQREDALRRLNEGALELCLEQKPAQSDLLHQMCLQLWREVIDDLVSQALWLRSLLGMPEDTFKAELAVPEEPDPSTVFGTQSPLIDSKAAGKSGKEERKAGAQEKRTPTGKDKEDRRGAAKPGKEERANSKKLKAKEEKRSNRSPSRDLKEKLPVEERVTTEHASSHLEPVDPLVQKKYQQRLYVEVYGLVESLVNDMVLLAEELRGKGARQQELLPPSLCLPVCLPSDSE
ncbi:MYCBP-associated protein isoform X1 [Ornithorhynchus anatinus]|uniref:MYCBP-associated protein isoform X1 n=1 Tax=Ornithorhynchus anatinus TaxID=9258 RepID=UPI000454538A|nr:MYCBP-associated protein isoform X1 [Ornithorhynchus anatinus]